MTKWQVQNILIASYDIASYGINPKKPKSASLVGMLRRQLLSQNQMEVINPSYIITFQSI